MQALIDLLAGFIAFLAAAVLSQFGVDLSPPHAPEPEIHRVQNCPGAPVGTVDVKAPAQDC
jgi:hypothetical protein